MSTRQIELSRSVAQRFVLLFGLGVVVFYSVFASPFFQEQILSWITLGYAQGSSLFLNLFGFATIPNGDVLGNESFSLAIKTGCDGIQAMALYVLAVAAFPLSKGGRKTKAIILGLAILIMANFGRIISLFLVGIYIPSWFDVLHFQVWQTVYILLAAVCFIYWLSSLPRQHSKSV